MNKAITKQNTKREHRISYTAVAVVALYILSMVMAAFWPLSGWWLVVAFSVITSMVLIFANYKDGQDSNIMLRPVAIGMIMIGLRVATIGTGPNMVFRSVSYIVAGALMALIGGVIAGYLLSPYILRGNE